MDKEEYQLELGVFEGPLDLLLHLIDKNELNIYDVPIHLLAEQYVAYLESLEDLDLEVASEFLIVASQLMYAKSKALLPKTLMEFDESEEDIEERLRLQLLEYRAFKKASTYLEKLYKGKKYYSRDPMERQFQSLELEPQSPLALLEAWKEFQRDEISLFEAEEIIALEPFNIEERMSEISTEIKNYPGKRIRLDLLLGGGTKGKISWLVAILAVLELVRLKKIVIEQSNAFAQIYIARQEGKQ